MDDDYWIDVNRSRWDERVPIHLDSNYYGLEPFLAGRDTLLPFERSELGEVRGKRLMHLQCHIGMDTLSWARSGAIVAGTDFSRVAIKAARRLAADIGITDSKFVVANIYDVAAAIPHRARYDVVYTGKGALNWLPDLDRWAQLVAALLPTGGLFYMVEFHPIANVLDERNCQTARRDYFAQGPREYELAGTYADQDANTHYNRGVEWHHTLGDIVSALANSGLRIDFLHEHEITTFGYFDEALSRHPDGYWVYPDGVPSLPLSYSLRARRLPRGSND